MTEFIKKNKDSQIAGEMAPKMEGKKLIELLRCVACDEANLTYEKRELKPWNKNVPLGESDIVCNVCSKRYPCTVDNIPIMWTEGIRDLLETGGGPNVIKANVEIYEKMSDQYMMYTRQNSKNKKRIISAVNRLKEELINLNRSNDVTHLDFGCGPGHVLGWTSGLTNIRVGLDVSLENLRNTRNATGALVVLGDAEKMPFKNGIFNLVTESSVLHHIYNWRSALLEACRVCSDKGGVLVDSEPSKNQLNLSVLASKIFDSRWHIYHLLSYVSSEKHMFRDINFAKKNYWEAEIHNQPGKGFDPSEIKSILERNGMHTELIMCPNENLKTKPLPNWKHLILQLASMQNPWDPKNGSFMILGFGKREQELTNPNG